MKQLEEGLRFTIAMILLLCGAVPLTMAFGLPGFLIWGALAVAMAAAYNERHNKEKDQ